MTDNGKPRRKRVLFLCTHNSARSQIAEGMLRFLAGGHFDVASAGTVATFVRPLAVQAMAELGIDITSHQSKTVDQFVDQAFDFVITLCDEAAESCPIFPGRGERLHWPFADPARAEGSQAEQLAACREVRDAIRSRIERDLL